MTSPMLVFAVRKAKNIPVVVVDAGHGGEDAGVVGKTSGMRESDLNLKIALLVGEILKGQG
ncbi:MAG: N-acetylmuramoyl-L-alanine amidase, partial [Clostridia bacterium]|nr:N-acetylmuramoyl-L-alanine amidase [Clostridia bacterium]